MNLHDIVRPIPDEVILIARQWHRFNIDLALRWNPADDTLWCRSQYTGTWDSLENYRDDWFYEARDALRAGELPEPYDLQVGPA